MTRDLFPPAGRVECNGLEDAGASISGRLVMSNIEVQAFLGEGEKPSPGAEDVVVYTVHVQFVYACMHGHVRR